jgi:hypothetical protein
LIQTRNEQRCTETSVFRTTSAETFKKQPFLYFFYSPKASPFSFITALAGVNRQSIDLFDNQPGYRTSLIARTSAKISRSAREPKGAPASQRALYNPVEFQQNAGGGWFALASAACVLRGTRKG